MNVNLVASVSVIDLDTVLLLLLSSTRAMVEGFLPGIPAVLCFQVVCVLGFQSLKDSRQSLGICASAGLQCMSSYRGIVIKDAGT